MTATTRDQKSIAQNRPNSGQKHTRHVTLRAMLAIDCTKLPLAIKLLVHVMALHADNVTGVGYYSQESIGRLMSCSDRYVRKLQDKLDEACERGESPVRITYERRHNNSSKYTITVKDDAVLNLRDLSAVESSGTPVPVNQPESTGTAVPVCGESTGTPVPLTPGLQFRSVGGEAEPRCLLSSESSSSESSSENKSKSIQRGGASAARAARAQARLTVPATPPPPTPEELERRAQLARVQTVQQVVPATIAANDGAATMTQLLAAVGRELPDLDEAECRTLVLRGAINVPARHGTPKIEVGFGSDSSERFYYIRDCKRPEWLKVAV